MADMLHPHQRAQLEHEQAQEAMRGPPVHESPEELAAAAATNDAAMRAAATGANRETAGGVRHEYQPPMIPSRSIKTMARGRDEPRMQEAWDIAKAFKKQGKDLRTQIKEADDAGNYGLAQQYFDELTAVRADAKTTRNNDPHRRVRLAQKKAGREERKRQDMANGTYRTKREKRMERLSKVEARAKRHAGSAEQAEKVERARVRGEERQATNAAVRRCHEHREQQAADHPLQESPPPPARDASDQEQSLRFVTSQQDKLSKQESHRYPGDWSPRREQQSARFNERSSRSLDVKLERIGFDGGPSARFSGDDDGAFEMGNDFVPLEANGRRDTGEVVSQDPLSPKGPDVQMSVDNFGSATRQPWRDRNSRAGVSPMPAAEPTEQQYQRARPMHGDGSKAFLDPGSTAYKIMSRMGWAQGRGLGKDGAGPQDFLKLDFKRDRKGVRETQAVVPVAQEIHMPAIPTATTFRGIPNPPSMSRFTQQASGALAVTEGFRPHELSGSRGIIIDLTQDAFGSGIDLASKEEEKHRKSNSNTRTIIDLTLEDVEPRNGGGNIVGPVFIDLTEDDDDHTGLGGIDDSMIVESTSTRDKAQEPHISVGTSRYASNAWPWEVLASIEAPELQSVAFQDEQMGDGGLDGAA